MTTAREDTVRLAELLRSEHQALGEFLVALATFDRERRWEELRYSGLFSFLTRELRLSNGAAQNRKTAAELIQRFPHIAAALRSGDLCLSSVNELAKVITPGNAAEVLPRFYGKSARDAAFVAASIRPVENPPERFTVTPVRGAAGVQAALAVPAPAAAAAPALQLHTYEVPAGPAASAVTRAVPPPTRPTIRPLDAERARMNVTVSRRLLDKLAAARDALSHSHPGASEETILEVGLDLIIERYRKRRGIGAKPRAKKVAAVIAAGAPATNGPAADAPATDAPATRSTVGAPASKLRSAPLPPPPRTRRSRHVPAGVQRAVWERDRGCCAWKLENGGVCGSTYKLELDHVEGWALGAGNTVDELRVACRPHQVANMRRLYGDALTDRYVRPPPPRCSEPVAPWGGRALTRRTSRWPSRGRPPPSPAPRWPRAPRSGARP